MAMVGKRRRFLQKCIPRYQPRALLRGNGGAFRTPLSINCPCNKTPGPRARRQIILYFAPIILNILVPHFSQVPVIALLVVPPLPFISTSFSSFIILFALHFTQYASVAILLTNHHEYLTNFHESRIRDSYSFVSQFVRIRLC